MTQELPQKSGTKPEQSSKEGTWQVDYQTQLDRLVDGELNAEEQRELFQRLDHAPHLWRTCALAFLEARAWQQDLVTMMQEEPAVTCAPSLPTERASTEIEEKQPTTSAWKLRFKQASPWFSMAASLFLAILVGLEVRDRWFVEPTVVLPNEVATTNPPAVATPNALLATDGHVAGSLTLNAANGQPLQMPIYTGEDYDEDWMLNQPSRVPADVRKTLEHMGFSIQVQRQLIPMYIGDGQRVLVPVDQVEIHPQQKVFQ